MHPLGQWVLNGFFHQLTPFTAQSTLCKGRQNDCLGKRGWRKPRITWPSEHTKTCIETYRDWGSLHRACTGLGLTGSKCREWKWEQVPSLTRNNEKSHRCLLLESVTYGIWSKSLNLVFLIFRDILLYLPLIWLKKKTDKKQIVEGRVYLAYMDWSLGRSQGTISSRDRVRNDRRKVLVGLLPMACSLLFFL